MISPIIPPRSSRPWPPLERAYNCSRLWAVFEPRTNTSRRKIFQNEYVEAFDGADRVLLREPADLAKIPVGERISVENLARDLNKRRHQNRLV